MLEKEAPQPKVIYLGGARKRADRRPWQQVDEPWLGSGGDCTQLLFFTVPGGRGDD